MGRWADSKLSPGPVIRAHHATLVDKRTGATRPRDLVELWMPPAVVGVVSLVQVSDFPDPAAGGLVGGLTLLAAFMFGLAMQILERSDELSTHGEPGPETSRRAERSRQLAANAAYASLVSGGGSAVLVAELFIDGWLGRVLGALGLVLAVHLLLVLMMVVHRVFMFTADRLNRARSGSDGGYWGS